MGQPMPLPERVPVPLPSQVETLTSMGIQFGDLNDEFTSMKLPDNWSFINDSHREDLPRWSIVDAAGMIRARVSGAWKGMYDNKLHFVLCEGNEKHVPRAEPTEPSEPRLMMESMVTACVDAVAKRG